MSKKKEKPKVIVIKDSDSKIKFETSSHPWEIRDYKGIVTDKGD